MAVATVFDGLRLEQEGAASVESNAEKRMPVIMMVLKGMVVSEAAAINDTVAVTLVAPPT